MCSSGAKRTSCVDDAVGGEVDHRLGGDALDVLGRLHHGERVLERRQVLQQVAGLGAGGEPRLQLVDVRRRQRPADLVGELDDRRRAQPAVEVVVQQRLRGRHQAAPSRRQTCMPLRHGTPACAGGRSAWPRTDTMMSVTR